MDSNPTTVWITVNPVNDAPVAVNDNYVVNEDATLVVAAAEGVLVNDYDVDGDSLYAGAIAPSHGTLNFVSDGSFSYTPYSNFTGTDIFRYHMHDGQAISNMATVTIIVNPTNDAPQAVGDEYAVNEDETLTIATLGILSNDADIDGDPLSAVLVEGPSQALSFILEGNGSFIYEPKSNYNGTDSFTYRAFDGQAYSQSVVVTINVAPVNDALAVAGDDGYEMSSGGVLNVPAPGLLENDTDIDGDALAAVIADAPQHAQAFELRADGSFTYQPIEGFYGSDSFTYRANDGWGDSEPAAVTILINGVPVAIEDAYDVEEDGALSVETAQGVLTNDSDPEADALAAILVEGPAHASSFVLNEDGSFEYSPWPDYYGIDGFGYRAYDGQAASDAVWVEIAIASVHDAPFAVDDSYTVVGDQTFSVNAFAGVLSNDTGELYSAILVDAPQHGRLSFRSDGSFDYIPDASYSGYDRFAYKAFDGVAFSETANVWFVGINDANLEAAIRTALAVPNGELTHSDLQGLTTLSADEMDIAGLDGIQHCQNLADLSLTGNMIDDLVPLAEAELASLLSLNLANNHITDLSSLAGAGLESLIELDLQYNQINNLSGLAGAGASVLSVLRLNNNHIDDIMPLAGAGLSNLTILDLSNNEINDLTPFNSAGMASLVQLNLSNNLIEDIESFLSPSGLADGADLNLNANPLSWTAYSQQLPLIRTRLTVHYEAMPSQVEGIMFHDLDNDGIIDDSEAGIGRLSVYVDVNGNGEFDPDEPTAVTAFDEQSTSGIEEGRFAIEDVMPGEIILAVVPQNGWKVWSTNPDIIEVGNDCVIVGVELASRKHFAGDANLDGTVDAGDSAVLAANWLKQGGATWTDGDFNGDGRVDDRDATLMAANWTPPAATVVSDPPAAEVVTDEPAAVYDLDNNGRIDLGDLAFFASVYREKPGVTTESPYAYAADFDRSGRVDLGDLAFFASHYQLGRSDNPQTAAAAVVVVLNEDVEKSDPLPGLDTTSNTDKASTLAADAAIFEEYGPQKLEQRSLQRQKLAWTNAYARRQSNEQENRILAKKAPAIDMLLSDQGM